MTILVVAEHNNKFVTAGTGSAISAAKEIGGDIDLLIAGSECQAAVDQAAGYEDLRKILKADDPAYAHGIAENLAPLVAKLSEHYSYILAPASFFGKNVMPRVAGMLDVQQISDISGIESPDTFIRPIYAGNAFATVKTHEDLKLLTVRGTAFDPANAESGGNAEVEEIETTGDAGLSSYVSEDLTDSDRPELTTARAIISGGRGMGSGEAFSQLENIADKLGAAIGASRAAVDAGYVPNDYQVGQTGKVVAPDLYIAVGISGAIQHLAGMKDSKVIVAINNDPDAPIFSVADYGLVADLFEALPELEKQL